ncbi:major facilitator superfamily transporter [Fusarium mexicanum]|uniref:Major facilitator superfamily transporter n=1 Tax=Fusarium mexicanum TaxID=751941 RepID=A0A8H5N6W7_9HYPO|nr:major facilitator superfamily transporter [Fusarium mexicanum]
MQSISSNSIIAAFKSTQRDARPSSTSQGHLSEQADKNGTSAVWNEGDESSGRIDDRDQESQLDKKQESKLRWKIDLYVVPSVALLWLFSFIDRANIGNARIAGLDESFNLQGYDYNIILSCFYISYILLEFPATVLCKWLGPGWFLPATSVMFGVCTICMSFAQTQPQVRAIRFLLGVFECGLLPGIAYYLSRWYRRSELTFRLSLYLVMSPLAGAFGGLFASAILKLDSLGSLTQWRMIFAIEGMITVFLGLVSFFTITDRPETARWLTAEEKRLCERRLQSERLHQTEVLDKIDKAKLYRGALNPATLTTAMAFFFSNVTVQGLGVFLPMIITTIYPEATIIQRQLYSVPPYILGACMNLIIPAISWKIDRRQIFMIGACPTIIVGYILFLASHVTHARYAACFLIASTAFIIGPLSAAQVSANVVSDTSRSSALATNVSYLLIHHDYQTNPVEVFFGNTGGLLSSWTFLAREAPHYPTGNGLNLACATMQMVVTISALIWFKWDNRKRSEVDGRQQIAGLSQREVEDLDWKHPDFRWKP